MVGWLYILQTQIIEIGNSLVEEDNKLVGETLTRKIKQQISLASWLKEARNAFVWYTEVKDTEGGLIDQDSLGWISVPKSIAKFDQNWLVRKQLYGIFIGVFRKLTSSWLISVMDAIIETTRR